MLQDAVRAALTPSGVRERLRARLVGGWSAAQVRARLPGLVVAEWLADRTGEPVVLERQLVEAVRAALLELVAAGEARRHASSYGVDLRSKGPRAVVVDVFRLA